MTGLLAVIVQQLFYVLSTLVNGYAECSSTPMMICVYLYILANPLLSAYVICREADKLAAEVSYLVFMRQVKS